MMEINGSIKITCKKDGDFIYQTIRIIPNAMKNLHFFMKDKYRLGRMVEDYLAKMYLGDLENILFIENNKYRNMITIKYQILNPDYEIDLSDKDIYFTSEVPANDSCLLCQHMRPLTNSEKVRCLYYRDFVKVKIHCLDFCEK